MCSNAKESGYFKGSYCLPFGEAGGEENQSPSALWNGVLSKIAGTREHLYT